MPVAIKKVRFFAIEPTCPSNNLFVLACTNHEDDLQDIYNTDRYQSVFATNSRIRIAQAAKRRGVPLGQLPWI